MHKSRMEAVDRRIMSLREEGVSLLADLVSKKSVLLNEKGAQEVVSGYLKRMGLAPQARDIDIKSISRHPAFAPVEWGYDDRPIVTASLPCGGSGKSLVLNGHIDVVPAEPLDRWETDPWELCVRGGRAYGRGAFDMKGGFVSALLAIRAILSEGLVPAGRVVFQSVIEEECSGNGTLSCVINGPRPDAALIFDTGPSTIGHVGVIWFRVTIAGAVAHAQSLDLDANCIEKASVVIAALRKLESSMNSDPRPKEFESFDRPIKLNIGTIKSGNWPSASPDICSIEFRLSCFPGTPIKVVHERVRTAISDACSADPWLRSNPPVVKFFGFHAEGSMVSPSSPIVLALQRAYQAIASSPLPMSYGTGCNDCRYFNLYAHSDAVVYGPTGGNLHGPNEYVDLDSIMRTARVYAAVIGDWCGFKD